MSTFQPLSNSTQGQEATQNLSTAPFLSTAPPSIMAQPKLQRWIVWGVLAVISVVYVVAAASSFHTVGDMEDNLKYLRDDEVKDQLTVNLRGARAACVLSMIVVVVYAAITFVFTIQKWFSEAAFDGILLGVLLTASLYSSAFMLLTGTVLQSNDLTVENSVGNSASRRFRFTFGMAYCLTGIYALLLIYYVWNKVSTMNNQGIENKQATRAPSHGPTPML